MLQRKWIVLILTVLFFSCSGEERTFYPEGGVESVLSFRQRTLHGKAVWYHKNGKKSLEICYVKGKKNGQMKRYALNGQCIEEAYYVQDSLDGTYKEFDSDGVLAKELHYKNGAKEGQFREFHADGYIRIQGGYKKGKMDGKWEFYDRNGFSVGEGKFTNGTGILTGYDSKGNLLRKVFYQNGNIDQEHVFRKDDKIVNCIYTYEQGRVVKILNMGEFEDEQ